MSVIILYCLNEDVLWEHIQSPKTTIQSTQGWELVYGPIMFVGWMVGFSADIYVSNVSLQIKFSCEQIINDIFSNNKIV